MAYYTDEMYLADLEALRKQSGDAQTAIPTVKQNTGLLGDLGTDIKRGAEQIPGAITGLMDIPVAAITGRPLISQGWEEIGKLTGVQPGKWAQEAQAEYSPERQAIDREINKVWEDPNAGALETAGAYLAHPSKIAGLVAESLPMTAAGGLMGRLAYTRGAQAAISPATMGAIPPGATQGYLSRKFGEKAGAIAGGIGEGAITAGATMDNLLEQGVDPRTAAGASLGAGALTGVIGGASGRLAQRMGMEDIESNIATMGRNATAPTTWGGVGKNIGKSMFQEGVLEELPQSVQEQMWSNAAQGKDLWEGIDRAGVEGMLAGAGMGGAANIRFPARVEPPPVQGADPAVDVVGGAPALPGGAPAANTPVADFGSMTYDQAAEILASMTPAEAARNIAQSNLASDVKAQLQQDLDAHFAAQVGMPSGDQGITEAAWDEAANPTTADLASENINSSVPSTGRNAKPEVNALNVQRADELATALLSDDTSPLVATNKSGRTLLKDTKRLNELKSRLENILSLSEEQDKTSRNAPYVEGSEGGTSLRNTAALAKALDQANALVNAAKDPKNPIAVSGSSMLGKAIKAMTGKATKDMSTKELVVAIKAAQQDLSSQMAESQSGEEGRIMTGGNKPARNAAATAQLQAAFDELVQFLGNDDNAISTMDWLVGRLKKIKINQQTGQVEATLDEDTGYEGTAADRKKKDEATRRNQIDTRLSHNWAAYRNNALGRIRQTQMRNASEEGGVGRQFTSALNALDHFRKHGMNAVERNLASVLYNILKNSDVAIKYETPPRKPWQNGEGGRLVNQDGKLTIYLRTSSPELIFHEILHAATTQWIVAHPTHGSVLRMRKALKDMRAALKTLNATEFNAADFGLTERQLAGVKTIISAIDDAGSRNNKDIQELMTYMLTNNEFGRFLQQLESSFGDTEAKGLEADKAEMRSGFAGTMYRLWDALTKMMKSMFGDRRINGKQSVFSAVLDNAMFVMEASASTKEQEFNAAEDARVAQTTQEELDSRADEYGDDDYYDAYSGKDVTETKATPSVNMTRLASLLGQQLYGDMSKMGDITIKELFQNSFDALKGAIERGVVPQEGAKIDISVDADARTITVSDNGTGMSPDTILNAFLQLAGTEKDTERSSGGFGIAKMQFLFGSDQLTLVTVKDGIESRLDTSGAQLMESTTNPEAAPSITSKPTDAPSGTTVTVKIPESYTNPSTGETVDIGMPTRPPASVLFSPLFEPIEVTYNGDSRRIGANFPTDEFTHFADVKFNWGNARIIVSKKESPQYGQNVSVLSNGLYQFGFGIKKDPNEYWGGNIPREFYINVEPKVRPEDPGYPFALNRSDFSAMAKGDFDKISKYLWVMYRGTEASDLANAYGTVAYLESDGTVGEQIDLTPPPAEEFQLSINEGDAVEVKDGRLIVNGREVPVLTNDDLAKAKVDLAKFKVDQDLIDSDKPLLHSDLEVGGKSEWDRINDQLTELRAQSAAASDRFNDETLSLEEQRAALAEFRELEDKIYDVRSARAAASQEVRTQDIMIAAAEKFGAGRVNKFLFSIGNIFRELRNAVAQRVPGYDGVAEVPVGVSLSKDPDGRLFGIHIRVPFQGMFVLPGAVEHSDIKRQALSLYRTMAHEITHHRVSDHGASFINADYQVDMELEVSGVRETALMMLQAALSSNKDIMSFLQETHDASTTKKIGAGFKDSSYLAGTGELGAERSAERQNQADAGSVTDLYEESRVPGSGRRGGQATEKAKVGSDSTGIPEFDDLDLSGVAATAVIPSVDHSVVTAMAGTAAAALNINERKGQLSEGFNKFVAAHPLFGKFLAGWVDNADVMAKFGEAVVNKLQQYTAARAGSSVLGNIIEDGLRGLDKAQAMAVWNALRDPANTASLPADLKPLVEHMRREIDKLIKVADERNLLDKSMKGATIADVMRFVTTNKADITTSGFSASKLKRTMGARTTIRKSMEPATGDIDFRGADVKDVESLLQLRYYAYPLKDANGKVQTDADGTMKFDQIIAAPAGQPVPAGAVEFRMKKATDNTALFIRTKDLAEVAKDATGQDLANYLANTIAALSKAVAGDQLIQTMLNDNKGSDKTKWYIFDGDDSALPEFVKDGMIPGAWVGWDGSNLHRSVREESRRSDRWVRLKGAAWGQLDGKIINGSVLAALYDMHATERIPNQTYNQVMRAWKINKTALSIPTHFTNVMSSFLLAYFHDIPMSQIKKAASIVVRAQFPKIARSAGMAPLTAEERKIWEDFQLSGAMLGNFSSNELHGRIAESLATKVDENRVGKNNKDGAWHHIDQLLQHESVKANMARGKSALDFSLAAYEAEDNIFRMAAYMTALKAGQTHEAAGKFAKQSMIDYQINARHVNFLRQTVLPFVAWPYRAAPMLARIAIEKPWKLGVVMGAMWTIGAIGFAAGGGDDDDTYDKLPEYMRQRIFGFGPRAYVRMPWGDAENPVFMNLGKWVPGADLVSSDEFMGIPYWPSAATPSGPWVAMLMAGVGYDPFLGRELRADTNTDFENAKASLKYLYEQTAPGLVVQSGKLADDLLNPRKGMAGNDINNMYAIARYFGLRTYQQNMADAEIRQYKELEALQRDFTMAINAKAREYARMQDPDWEDFNEWRSDKLQTMADKVASIKGED